MASGQSPPVAMHVPVPLLRANPAGEPCSAADLARASIKMSESASGGSNTGITAADCEVEDESLVSLFPAWHGWTTPSVALTLRAVLMTASALTAAAGMQQPMIGIEKGADKNSGSSGGSNPNLEGASTQEELARRRRGPQILLPEGVVPHGDLSDLRTFFETLWPNSPYSFGTYNRDSVNSDTPYLNGSGDGAGGGGWGETRRKGEKRLVVVVNVSSPGNEDAAESDGEGMVNAAETLLELGKP